MFQPLLKLVFSVFFRSPVKACKPVVYLASSSQVKGKSIDYLFLMQRLDMDSLAADPGNGKWLWDKTEALVNTLLIS